MAEADRIASGRAARQQKPCNPDSENMLRTLGKCYPECKSMCRLTYLGGHSASARAAAAGFFFRRIFRSASVSVSASASAKGRPPASGSRALLDQVWSPKTCNVRGPAKPTSSLRVVKHRAVDEHRHSSITPTSLRGKCNIKVSETRSLGSNFFVTPINPECAPIRRSRPHPRRARER